MSVISAGTTTTTAFKVTGDTTGTLQLQTGAVPTTAINISATQVVTFPATTTLDFTGTLRLSGGTANGVLYLNGSKDVTGGSTLTFDGTTFTSGAHTLSTGVLTVPAGTVSAPAITTSGDTNTGIFFPAADTIAFAEGGTEAMRIDSSANVGIGTSSPAGKLDVSSAGNLIISNKTAAPTNSQSLPGYLEFNGFGWNTSLGSQAISGRITFAGSYAPSGPGGGFTYPYLAFSLLASTGSLTEYMRLDSLSGSLGLGITPVASFAGYKTFQIASQGVVSSDSTSNGELEINNNAYRAPTTAALTYINSFAATKYAQYRGEHRWFTAPSGTAGNTISFTQAMTLNASGKLLIGTTTASGSNMIVADAANSGGDVIRAQNTGGAGARISAHANGSTNVGQGPNFYMQNVSGAGTWASSIQMGAGSEILFFQYPNGLWYERARITSAGAFFGALSVGSGSSAGGIFTASQNAMMSKYADSGSTPSVTFNLNYEQATNGWETGTLMVYASATQNVLTGNTGAWWFYHVAHFSSTFALYLADSGGNTGGFSISAGSVASGAGTKSAPLTITTTGTQTYLSVQVFFSNPYGVYSIT